MFCKNCGNKLDANDKVCAVCGEVVESSRPTNAPEEENETKIENENKTASPVDEDIKTPLFDFKWNVQDFPKEEPRTTEDIDFSWGAPKDAPVVEKMKRAVDPEEIGSASPFSEEVEKDVPVTDEWYEPFSMKGSPEDKTVFRFNKRNEEFQELLDREYEKYNSTKQTGSVDARTRKYNISDFMNDDSEDVAMEDKPVTEEKIEEPVYKATEDEHDSASTPGTFKSINAIYPENHALFGEPKTDTTGMNLFSDSVVSPFDIKEDESESVVDEIQEDVQPEDVPVATEQPSEDINPPIKNIIDELPKVESQPEAFEDSVEPEPEVADSVEPELETESEDTAEETPKAAENVSPSFGFIDTSVVSPFGGVDTDDAEPLPESTSFASTSIDEDEFLKDLPSGDDIDDQDVVADISDIETIETEITEADQEITAADQNIEQDIEEVVEEPESKEDPEEKKETDSGFLNTEFVSPFGSFGGTAEDSVEEETTNIDSEDKAEDSEPKEDSSAASKIVGPEIVDEPVVFPFELDENTPAPVETPPLSKREAKKEAKLMAKEAKKEAKAGMANAEAVVLPEVDEDPVVNKIKEVAESEKIEQNKGIEIGETPISRVEINPGTVDEHIGMSTFTKVLIAIIVVVLVLIGGLGIMKFAPNSMIGMILNNAIGTKISGIGTTQSATQSPPSSDFNALIESQKGINKNIKKLGYNSSVLFDENANYPINGANNSQPIQNNFWKDGPDGKLLFDEQAVKSVIGYNSAWVDYVNSADGGVFNFVIPASNAEDALRTEKLSSGSKAVYNQLEIGEIRQNGNLFYVWTEETITIEKQGSKSNPATIKQLYELEAAADSLLITNITNIASL